MSPRSQRLNAVDTSGVTLIALHEQLDLAAAVLQLAKLALPITRLAIRRPAIADLDRLLLERLGRMMLVASRPAARPGPLRRR